LFEHLLASDAPLVFHCTAARDRTGFAAALILLALGVPRPVVMQDYLLTNELLRMDSAPGLRHSARGDAGAVAGCRPSFSTPPCTPWIPTTAASTPTCSANWA
jgi:protein tyrosine/serine phosphatase